MKVLILSNGKGEDSIAVTVLDQLRQLFNNKKTDIDLTAMPIIGNGNGYAKAGIKVIGSNDILPSGGFVLQKFSSFITDIRAGLFALHSRQLKTIKQESPDMIIAFGDIFPVILALLSGKPVIHVGTAYSVHLRKLIALEKWLFRKCRLILSRDEPTAVHLRDCGINAVCVGNPMMDDPLLSEGTNGNKDLNTHHLTVGLIPSSRIDAYDNLQKMLDVIQYIPQKENIAFLVSVAPNLETKKIESIISEYKQRLELRLVKGSLGDVIRPSKIAIGMTGTGNEQVVGLNTPLVLLQGGGPQSSSARMKHYQRLLGDAVFVPQGNKEQIGQQIGELIKDEQRLTRMGKVGLERMGPPGAALKMAEIIREYIKE
ncbi:MAG: lipid-A-disaccharide synthase-related protein [Candidatus Margulisiibacteriota bacterium]